IAAKQAEEERPKPPPVSETLYPMAGGRAGQSHAISEDDQPGEPIVLPPPPPRLGRFHGSVALDATRLGRDAGKIAEEVIQHLSTLTGAQVEVTLEIQVEIPEGAPDHIVRTVTENCRTLRFANHEFEEV